MLWIAHSLGGWLDVAFVVAGAFGLGVSIGHTLGRRDARTANRGAGHA